MGWHSGVALCPHAGPCTAVQITAGARLVGCCIIRVGGSSNPALSYGNSTQSYLACREVPEVLHAAEEAVAAVHPRCTPLSYIAIAKLRTVTVHAREQAAAPARRAGAGHRRQSAPQAVPVSGEWRVTMGESSGGTMTR